MTQEITGTLTPRSKRHWGGFNTVYYSQCDAVLSCGERLSLCYQGRGRKREYFALDANGTPLARSQRMHTTGWRSFINDSLYFMDEQETPIMTLSGRIFPTRLRFGDTDIPFRNRYRKWFKYVLESEYFEFEQKGFTELRFVIKQPRFLLPSLCFGYYFFVNQTENAGSSGG